MRILIAGLAALALAGCAHITPRDNEPSVTLHSSASLDDTAACVVRSLNTQMHTNNPLGVSITHKTEIIEPGRVYEVSPQQTITLTAEIYFIRLTAVQPSGTRIDVHVISTWRDQVEPAVRFCAT